MEQLFARIFLVGLRLAAYLAGAFAVYAKAAANHAGADGKNNPKAYAQHNGDQIAQAKFLQCQQQIGPQNVFRQALPEFRKNIQRRGQVKLVDLPALNKHLGQRQHAGWGSSSCFFRRHCSSS